MSKSFLQPTQETDIFTATKNAQKYFSEKFNDNSFVVISAMPGHTYQCFTENNQNEYYYFKLNG